MKQIIAFSRNKEALEHPEYEWFEDESGLTFNNGKPIVLRFGDNYRECYNQKTARWFDCDNDLVLYWYYDEEDAEGEDYIDYDYICGSSSITFLFDDGTTKQFKVRDGNAIWDEWDVANEEPIGVYKELIKFLEEYIKNGGYESPSKYMIVPEVEFMDI
jgi:hypothetical protein